MISNQEWSVNFSIDTVQRQRILENAKVVVMRKLRKSGVQIGIIGQISKDVLLAKKRPTFSEWRKLRDEFEQQGIIEVFYKRHGSVDVEFI